MSNPHPSDPRRHDELPPGSIDPNDPVAPRPVRRESGSQTSMMWAWVAGLAVLAVIVAFVFGGGSGSQTANNEPVPQPRQTGSVERPAPPPAITGQTNAPTNTPAGTQNPSGSGSTTTGSGTSQ